MNKKFKILALLVAIVALIFCQVNTTLCYIVTETPSITNMFVPVANFEDVTVNININKTVNNTGNFSITPEGFEFVLENTLNGEKISVKSNELGVAIIPLTFTQKDVGKEFSYKLSEVNSGIKDLEYDTTVYDIIITISSNIDNNLIPTVKINGEEVADATVTFENIYHSNGTSPAPPTKSDTAAIPMIMMFISGCVLIRVAIADKRNFRIKKN